eukprot:m51a1_g2701 hypothetical protein (87) ;mRNA; f:804133-804555
MSVKNSDQMILERSSTRVSAPPGGKSSICFCDGSQNEAPAPRAPVQQQQQQQQQRQNQQQESAPGKAHTSVRVSNPPGGKSSIFFG